MDYSHYYRIYHNDTAEHEALMVSYHKKQLSPHLPQHRTGKVLDVGCGMGFAIRALCEMGFNDVSGIEVDKSQAEYCKTKNLNVDLVDDSIEYLQKHTQEYVLITILDVLEHVPTERQIAFLTAIHNSLVPGGRTIIQVPNANSPVAVRWFYNDFTHFRSYTENSIRFVLANAALQGFLFLNQVPWDGHRLSFGRRLREMDYDDGLSNYGGDKFFKPHCPA